MRYNKEIEFISDAYIHYYIRIFKISIKMHKNDYSLSTPVYVWKKKKRYVVMLDSSFRGGFIPTVIKENQSSNNGRF